MLSPRRSLLKENELSPFVGSSLFLYACVAPFSCQRLLGVSAYSNFLIQFKFLFIYLFPTTSPMTVSAIFSFRENFSSMSNIDNRIRLEILHCDSWTFHVRREHTNLIVIYLRSLYQIHRRPELLSTNQCELN